MTLLIVIHALICVFLVGVILLQPGKGDAGVGFGSSSQTIFGSKGAGNFLTKTTSACAVLFLLTSFFLTRSRIMEYSKSVISEKNATAAPKKEVPKEAPKSAAPTAPPAGTKAPETKAAPGAKK